MRPITCPLPRIRPPRICYASHLWLCDAGLPGRPPGRSSGPACCRSSPQQCCPRCSEDSRSRTWPWLLSFTSRTWRNRRCERYQKQRTRDFFADRLPSFDRLRRPHENLLPNCSSVARGSAFCAPQDLSVRLSRRFRVLHTALALRVCRAPWSIPGERTDQAAPRAHAKTVRGSSEAKPPRLGPPLSTGLWRKRCCRWSCSVSRPSRRRLK